MPRDLYLAIDLLAGRKGITRSAYVRYLVGLGLLVEANRLVRDDDSDEAASVHAAVVGAVEREGEAARIDAANRQQAEVIADLLLSRP